MHLDREAALPQRRRSGGEAVANGDTGEIEPRRGGVAIRLRLRRRRLAGLAAPAQHQQTHG
jgi:hypothetical protein